MDIEKICKNNERETKESSDLTFRLAEEHLMENPAYNKNKTVYQFYIKNCLQGARGSFLNIQFTLAIELSNQNSFSSHLSQISSIHSFLIRQLSNFRGKLLVRTCLPFLCSLLFNFNKYIFFLSPFLLNHFKFVFMHVKESVLVNFLAILFLLLVKEQKCLVFFIEVFTL